MKGLFLLFVLNIFLLFSCGQSYLKKVVQDNVHKINSISGSQNSSDLRSLAKAIGNAKVVMLGEQDHGDATTFEAKIRIIQYLHEHHGFDVLAFESDFFALNEAWEEIKTSNDLSNLIETNLFQIWTGCQQFDGLKKYLLTSYQKDNPLQITGFDVQLHGMYSQKHFSDWFINFLRKQKALDFINQEPTSEFIFMLDSVVYHSKKQTSVSDTLTLKLFHTQLAQIEKSLIKHIPPQEYEMQVLKSLQSQVIVMLCRNGSNIRKGAQERDRQMADNLNWLTTHPFAGRKVIVWAANSHIYSAPFEIVPNYFHEPYYPMGYFIKSQDSTFPVYSLGFTSYEGSSQRIGGNSYQIHSKEKNSLEEWVNDTNVDFAFIDLDNVKKSFNNRRAFMMAGAGHFQIKQHWMEGFNGMFYIKKMEPCKGRE
jgi:erythromycin esterase